VRLLALLLVATAVGAEAPSAPAATPAFFQTPSRNIGCIFVLGLGAPDKPYLRCDIGGGLRPLPPKPRSCDLDWGYGYAMFATGPAKTFCAGDTARDPRAPVLAYGRRWRKGPFTCVSRSVGLRCTNRSGRGFFLSRERSYTF
jgi:hypothetical protein